MLLFLAFLLAWFGVMCSPIGEVVAIITILTLIIVFFILGFIDVQQPNDRL